MLYKKRLLVALSTGKLSLVVFKTAVWKWSGVREWTFGHSSFWTPPHAKHACSNTRRCRHHYTNTILPRSFLNTIPYFLTTSLYNRVQHHQTVLFLLQHVTTMMNVQNRSYDGAIMTAAAEEVTVPRARNFCHLSVREVLSSLWQFLLWLITTRDKTGVIFDVSRYIRFLYNT